MSAPIKFIIQFILIMSFQILILNSIVIKSTLTLGGIPVFIPMIYPLLILTLPLNTPSWLTMLLGFFIGITMDVFGNTPGVHASACVLLGYIRPYLLNLFFQQNIKELGTAIPSLFRMGFSSFMLYVLLAIFTHHFFFYMIQIWSFKNLIIILGKTILSTFLTLILILLIQLLFSNRKISRL